MVRRAFEPKQILNFRLHAKTLHRFIHRLLTFPPPKPVVVIYASRCHFRNFIIVMRIGCHCIYDV